MQRQNQWRGGLQLTARTAGSFARLGIDFLGNALGSALPRTEEQIAHPEVINNLTQEYSPPGETPLPRAVSVRLPGVQFESSNCKNFLLELEFEQSITGGTLPRTLYAKLPCDELMTRSFANTMGFWSLECNFCEHVASHIPIRIPRVYVSAQRGSRFVLLLENLNEIPGVELFTNRDMASGTTSRTCSKSSSQFCTNACRILELVDCRSRTTVTHSFPYFPVAKNTRNDESSECGGRRPRDAGRTRNSFLANR